MNMEIISDLVHLPFEKLFLLLSEHYKQKGFRDVLLNALFERKIEDIVFHLPQLAILLAGAGNQHVHKLIDHFSKKNQCFLFLVILNKILFSYSST